MPQTIDPLAGRLDASYTCALREFFAYYEIEILSCMFWRNRAPWNVPTRKCHDTFFLFPLRGRVRVTLASGNKWIGPGTYLALPDDIQHSLRLEKGHNRLDQIALHARIQDRWKRPFLGRLASPVAELRDAARWYRVLSDLACLMTRDPELGQQRGRVLVSELLAERLLAEKKLAPLGREGDPRIEQVLRRMKEQLASPELSVESLAREIELTPTQMRKLFHRETRTKPKAHLDRLRLERAAYLLHHSAQTIKQVAFDCGFSTDNYFHRVFRNAFGVTPADYRKKEIL